MRRGFSGLPVLLALSAASPIRDQADDIWTAPLHDCSLATRSRPGLVVQFVVQTPDGRRRPGILLTSDRLRPRIEPGRFYPELRLQADGVTLHTGAHGEVFEYGDRFYFFEFDIEPMLRRYPDGFSLVLLDSRHRLVRADLKGARSTFARLLACAGGRLSRP